MYLDINVLQSVPASNINRDDTGAPKTVIYGGALRARVSSQSWKRAMREDFNRTLTDGGKYSLRTKQLPKLIAKEYTKLHPDLDYYQALLQAAEVCEATKSVTQFDINKIDDIRKEAPLGPDSKTLPTLKTLAMLTPSEIKTFAEGTDQYRENPSKITKKISKQLAKILEESRPLDRALFGRMVASNKDLSIDASVQVAHAVSTHEIQREYDYFTAVDDVTRDSGAAMIETTDFNSSTLFRYGNVNIDGLINNSESTEDAIAGLKLFLKSFVLSMPTGHENSFANKTLPQYVLFTLRDDTPVNLVSAFEDPVEANDGFIDPSISAFEKEFAGTSAFVDHPILTEIVTNKDSNLTGNNIIHATNLTAAINEMTAKINDLLTTQSGD